MGQTLTTLLFWVLLVFNRISSSGAEEGDSPTGGSRFYSKFGGALGASVGLGALANNDRSLSSRTMNALFLEALPGYRWDWGLLGIHADYRSQGQTTSLSGAGGTNLGGHGFLLGIGSKLPMGKRLSLQTAFDFIGKYTLAVGTDQGDETSLSSPLGLGVKIQYLFENDAFSADLDLQYLHWNHFTIGSTTFSSGSTQWMAGLGLSYHFGAKKETSHE